MAMLSICVTGLYSFIKKLKDFFHFLQVTEIPTKSKLLFVHQSAYQKSLMKKYRNRIVLLDATYKTTKYSIPLFFVAVKTNVKYMVVGSCAIQEETKEAITEAMDILKLCNESWSPVCFMVDNWIKEIHCLEHLFRSNYIFIHMSYIQASFIIFE